MFYGNADLLTDVIRTRAAKILNYGFTQRKRNEFTDKICLNGIGSHSVMLCGLFCIGKCVLLYQNAPLWITQVRCFFYEKKEIDIYR